MTDIVDKLTRSRMMAGIQGKDTKPELKLRSALHRLGLRYKLHAAELPGRPDLVFPKFKAVIEVQGCFWHRHEGCRYCSMPTSNIQFWKKKFARTIERDRENVALLLKDGWRVAVIWECALKDLDTSACATKVGKWIKSSRKFMELPHVL
jgi:DNA mismatch endonuclease, patch repair protein